MSVLVIADVKDAVKIPDIAIPNTIHITAKILPIPDRGDLSPYLEERKYGILT